MTVSAEIVEQVRRRAGFACEYCGVTEIDSGGELTVDHFQPKTQRGSDDLGNLIYCCYRCNLFKRDFWPGDLARPTLWNPRREPREDHVRVQDDGTLLPLTPSGELTLRVLRLNRPQLLARRLRQRRQVDAVQMIRQLQEILTALEGLYEQQAGIAEEQLSWFESQLAFLRLLTGGRE